MEAKPAGEGVMANEKKEEDHVSRFAAGNSNKIQGTQGKGRNRLKRNASIGREGQVPS
jgi:hypothetical protein